MRRSHFPSSIMRPRRHSRNCCSISRCTPAQIETLEDRVVLTDPTATTQPPPATPTQSFLGSLAQSYQSMTQTYAGVISQVYYGDPQAAQQFYQQAYNNGPLGQSTGAFNTGVQVSLGVATAATTVASGAILVETAAVVGAAANSGFSSLSSLMSTPLGTIGGGVAISPTGSLVLIPGMTVTVGGVMVTASPLLVLSAASVAGGGAAGGGAAATAGGVAVTSAESVASGTVSATGKLLPVLQAIEAQAAASAPTTIAQGIQVVEAAATSQGLSAGFLQGGTAAVTAIANGTATQAVLTNAGGIITTVFSTGQIIVTNAQGTVILNIIK